jgi:hypothetical protein
MRLQVNRMENPDFFKKKQNVSPSPSPPSLLHSHLTFSHNSTGLTDQALHINRSATNFPHMWHVLSITAFCNRSYKPGGRPSSFKLPDNLYPIIPVLDSTGGIRTICSWHILIRYSFKSVYLCSFSVMVLWRLWLLGTATSIEHVSLMVWSSISMSSHGHYISCHYRIYNGSSPTWTVAHTYKMELVVPLIVTVDSQLLKNNAGYWLWQWV